MVTDSEVIEIDIAAWQHGCEVEESESATHKVHQVVSQMVWLADSSPPFSVQVVEEGRNVGPVFEVAIDPQVDAILSQRNPFDLDRSGVFSRDYDD